MSRTRMVVALVGCANEEPGRSALCFFFFQAEDGIRDLYVTGVQTCALPIFSMFAAVQRFGLDGGGEDLELSFEFPGKHAEDFTVHQRLELRRGPAQNDMAFADWRGPPALEEDRKSVV